MTAILLLLVCLLAAGCWIAFSESRRWRAAAEEQSRLAVRLEAEVAKERELAAVQIDLLKQTELRFEERFRALANEALRSNSQLFLEGSREQFGRLVEPVQQSLRRFEEQVQAIEQKRAGAYESISAKVAALTELQERVRLSAEGLKTALRSPVQRGRWGEIQLRRVVELAGMLEHCDFAEQQTLFGERRLRPDLVVHLPNGCQVVVDSKVSLEAYLRALECEGDAERQRFLADHSRQVRGHIKSLAEKSYWQQFDCSPEFVVAFLPLESLFSSALEQDGSLLAFAAQHKVVVASPVTLISLLMTVAHGWQRQSIADDTKALAEQGVQLYERLVSMSTNFQKLGSALENTVASYNSAMHSLEQRVFVSGRKLKKLGSNSAPEIAEAREIEGPRKLH